MQGSIRHCCLVAFVIIIVIDSGRAQGPAPSPLVPRPPPPAAAQATTPAPAQSPATLLTKEDVQTFLDALVPDQLQNRNMAGAVVSVVKDGQVLVERGYGYADFAAKKPVLPDRTLFRPGSISKLFTAIAVMQLVEQGKLDLDRDVNEYLDFQIPKTYAEPVTLRRLLTHTGGFEEVVKNLFVVSAQETKPLHDYLVVALPARIFPPGRIPAYSNYGLALAGYIVQRVSGEKFEAYIDNHILKPLKMQSSTFEQPLPGALSADMSKGYLVATKPAKDFEFVEAAPAGALSITAADMSRFMLAMLQDGALDGAAILKPESLRAMQAHQFELHPTLNGIGFVFFDYSTNGQHIVGHGGDTLWFHSDLYLFTEAHVGLFISYNSAGVPRPISSRVELERAFLDRYFPDTRPAAKAVDLVVAREDGLAAAGVYQTTRRAETTLLKLGTLFGQTAVKSDHDGALTIEDSKNQRGELKKWRETGPLLYHEVDGPGLLAFRRDPSGKVNELLPQLSVFEFQRVPWYENKQFINPILLISIAVTALTVLLWPVTVVCRKKYQRPLFSSTGNRIIYLVSRIVCLIELAFLVILAVLTKRVSEEIALLGNAANHWLQLLHLLGWSFSAGTIFLIFAAILFWKTRAAGWWARTHAVLLALSGIAFVLIAWHWHLLDASTKF
jgi:CubicO group peptidase (beta-lactamase class C family)